MSIRERLYPREQELSVLARHCADARSVWNLAHLNNAIYGFADARRRSPPILSCENSPKLAR